MKTRPPTPQTTHGSRPLQRALLLFATLLLGIALLNDKSASAQDREELPGYWQYSTSARLSDVLVADMNLDGVEEFLVVDENKRLDLISASGELLWNHTVNDSIRTLAVIDLVDSGEVSKGVVVGMPNQLILLSAEGREIWRAGIRPLDIQSSLSGVDESAGAEDVAPNAEAFPVEIQAFRESGNGQAKILVLLGSGELILFDTDGKQTWQHKDHRSDDLSTSPQMLVADFDLDGQDEIVLSVFNSRRFGQLVFIDSGVMLWDLSLSRKVTDLEEVLFREGSQPLFAVSTTSGHVQLFDHLRRRHWLRTLNTPATALAEVHLPDQTVLAVGTDTGTITAFDEQGRSLWTTNLADTADRPILAVAAAPHVFDVREPVLAATLQDGQDGTTADIILVDGRGKTSSKIADADGRDLARFVDSNNDQNSELLVPRFATLELVGMGVGNSGAVQEWEYSLNAAPGAVLTTDLDQDGNDELIVGTQDGRVHSLSNNRSLNWLLDAGGSIQALAILAAGSDRVDIVVSGSTIQETGEQAGWIQLRDAKGERIWEHAVGDQVTDIAIADTLGRGDLQIAAGTDGGTLFILSASGERLLEWTVPVPEQRINHVAVLNDDGAEAPEIIVAGQFDLFSFDPRNPQAPARSVATFEKEIAGLLAINASASEGSEVGLIVATADGHLHGFDATGSELTQRNWPLYLGAEVTAGSLMPQTTGDEPPASQSQILLGTNGGDLLRLDLLDSQPQTYWSFDGLGKISAVHWFDQNDDALPDTAMAGNEDGQVTLFEKADTSAPNSFSTPLQFTSSIFGVDSLKREASPIPDLVVIGENGLVHLLRTQDNRPPLLTKPEVKAELGQYRVSIDVDDVEEDEVAVTLELQDPETGAWVGQEIQVLNGGEGTLFWAFPAQAAQEGGLAYRFSFTDGSYTGMMVPPPGPAPILAPPGANIAPFAFLGIAAAGLILGVAFIRQAQTPNARASRLYQRIRENPSETLVILEQLIESDLPPDLIPHLAGQARQEGDKTVATLADGLFILPEQPLSAIPIITQMLDEMSLSKDGPFAGHARWQSLFGTGQILLEAPSVTELSLQLPRLELLLTQLKREGQDTSAYDLLNPILLNLCDSERVDLVEDRLVYLNEAGVILQQANQQLPQYAPSLRFLLVNAIMRRWSGLITAEVEDLQGRAELAVTLKTRRLVPDENTAVALEIANKGRAPAENLIAVLDDNPAFIVQSSEQRILFLPPGRVREVSFIITPRVTDRFRLGMTVTYSDRNDSSRSIAFGDMVHLLPPVRDYTTIVNPYTPGTPLRQDSLLFYGREDLFEFISENTGHRSYRNVQILVGQRRTGKTSALLRLEDHLPDHLLPVYIDCQSLGVVPGMPALLEELSWYISDALSKRGIQVDVPDLSAWEQDPTRLFQRQFLPYIISLLPEGTTLILVFDEFEAFETLVAEGILPSTFFTYLRHLMQHSEQLNFIFVGTRRLEEMTSDYWSVLFNIALYRKIGFLSEAATLRLISEPVSPGLIYDDLALDKIMRVTAGHPYFLQLVCYTLVKQANVERSGYVTISHVNAAVDEMLSLGEVHFAYLWQRSTVAERTILAAVAHLMDHTLPFHPEVIVQLLEPYDIHLDPAEITGALSSLVKRDILREVTEEAKSLYEVKLGLVVLWVAKNKSLSKLYAGAKARTNGRSPMETAEKQ